MAYKYYFYFVLVSLQFSYLNGDDVKSVLVLEKEILDNLINSTSYDPRIRPLENSNVLAPTKVRVNMYLRLMNRIDDIRMLYNAQLTLRQKWVDNRLRYDNLEGKLNTINLFDEKIWTPDLFISNEFAGYINSLMKPNKYIRIYPDGNVLYSTRVTLVLNCPMNFKFFPFDTQICPIILESYGFTSDDVTYKWEDIDPIVVGKDVNFVHYTLLKHEFVTRSVSLLSGNYSALIANFYLKRKLAHYVFHLFMPTIFLVMTSWVNLWIENLMSRVFIVVSALLVLGYKVSDFNSTLPPVNYTRSVDVWTGTCILYVFSALLEVATVDYTRRQMQRQQRRHAAIVQTKEEDEEEGENIELNEEAATTNNTNYPNTRMGRLRNFYYRRVESLPADLPKKLDIISRFVFPFSFLFFNILYWLVNLVFYAL